MKPLDQSKIDEAYRSIWYGARLWPLLHPGQRKAYFQFYASPQETTFCLDVARRWGKTTLTTILAFECALTRKNATIVYAAPTAIDARDIVTPIFKRVLETCPEELRPETKLGRWTFPSTGAVIRVVGLDKTPDKARGSDLDFGVIDECGFIRDPEYVLDSVFMPQTQGRPWARIALASTPARSPGHPWSRNMVPYHKARGDSAYVHGTIYDNPFVSEKEIQRLLSKHGPETSTWRREYLAEHVIDLSSAVAPEWQQSKADCLIDRPPPAAFDRYVSLDPGFDDLTVALLGYWDFLAQTLVIEDEVVLRRPSPLEFAESLRAKETERWGTWKFDPIFGRYSEDPQRKPFMRVSDVDKRLIWDLRRDYGIDFSLVQKDDKDTAIANVRYAIQQKKIIVHPRCVTLARTLDEGVWRVNRRGDRTDGYESSQDLGHLDAFDALIYLWRSVVRERNPFPAIQPTSTLFVPPQAHAGETRAKRILAGLAA